jgi:hypothetical protein
MNNLPKIKRQQLILVGIFTVGMIAALLLFVGDAQRAELKKTRGKTESIRTRLTTADAMVRSESKVSQDLTNAVKELSAREALLAPERDTYAWMLQSLGEFMAAHKGAGVTAAGISQPEVNDATLIPKFPYKAATFHVKSSGYFHDFGKFIADLETQFPYVRVQNIDIARAGNGTGADAEKLNLAFDVVMLMQPSTSIENR